MKEKLAFLLIFFFLFLNFNFLFALSEKNSETETFSATSIKKVIGEWNKSLEELLKKGWGKRKEIWQGTQKGMKFSFKIIKSLFLKIWEWIEAYILSFPPIERKILKISEFFLHKVLK